MTEKRLKLVIVTSSPAPYRIPVFDHLSDNFELGITIFYRNSPIHNWPKSKAERWSWISKLHFFILVFNPRVNILSTLWEHPILFPILLVRASMGLPTIGFYESTIDSHRFGSKLVVILRNFYFKRMQSIVCVGKASKNALLEMGVHQSRIFEGFNAVDVKNFNAYVSHRGTNHIPDSHRFVYVGRLVPDKRVDLALKSWSRMRGQFDSFEIVGDGPELEKLKLLVQELGISNNVIFSGYKHYSEMPQTYSQSDTLVLVSKAEVWGLVVNEALASGLHVVVVENSGVGQSVNNMRGVYICEGNVASIEKAMINSKADWLGPITNPEILKFTPEKLAETITQSVNLATR